VRIDPARLLHFGGAVVVGAFLAFVVLPRVAPTRTSPEPQSADELHRTAIAAAAKAPPAVARAALAAVAASLADPDIRTLYERGIDLLAAGRTEDAEVAFTVALRRERERDLEW